MTAKLVQRSTAADETLSWRGSASDLATDVHALLTPAQCERLITELRTKLTPTMGIARAVTDHLKPGGDLTAAEILIACRNIGFDLTCGACAGQFYTGASLGDHTCNSNPARGEPKDRNQ